MCLFIYLLNIIIIYYYLNYSKELFIYLFILKAIHCQLEVQKRWSVVSLQLLSKMINSTENLYNTSFVSLTLSYVHLSDVVFVLPVQFIKNLAYCHTKKISAYKSDPNLKTKVSLVKGVKIEMVIEFFNGFLFVWFYLLLSELNFVCSLRISLFKEKLNFVAMKLTLNSNTVLKFYLKRHKLRLMGFRFYNKKICILHSKFFSVFFNSIDLSMLCLFIILIF
ncbi:hypothetical protein KUTeg_003644 [Tegillarca granosa]|uniref:Uncharacterized protein n=1 Tax=Tegillarca granosa TaxID=220873 RepID=A0ABQ9FS83_TEGGR|nr:hypothetical protein KUTeg_003644 [Tegillarca granosa]